MAIDSWVPHRFSLLSERLVTQNGVILMGAAAIAMLVYARGSIDILVVMYSINVFLTFTLSQLGMCVHWWQVRKTERTWVRRFAVNGAGLAISVTILVVSMALKFREGGWMTVVITGALVALCVAVKKHYGSVSLLMKRADDVLTTLPTPKTAPGAAVPAPEPGRRRRSSSSRASTASASTRCSRSRSTFRATSGTPSSSPSASSTRKFKGTDEMENLRLETERDLNKYVEFARGLGMHAEQHHAIGIDLLDEIVALCKRSRSSTTGRSSSPRSSSSRTRTSRTGCSTTRRRSPSSAASSSRASRR